VPISIAAGMELNNWIDPNVRVILKYNFLADKLLSPYIDFEAHGGILDILSYGLHLGGGLDIQINEWYFIALDFKGGYESESKVQDKLSTNLKATDFDNELEGSISIGMGVKIPTRKLYLSWKEKHQNK
jgi:hypothetical protein